MLFCIFGQTANDAIFHLSEVDYKCWADADLTALALFFTFRMLTGVISCNTMDFRLSLRPYVVSSDTSLTFFVADIFFQKFRAKDMFKFVCTENVSLLAA